MNSTTTSASTPAADVPLTRAAKEKLLLQMYSRKHWIELIRLFRYQTLPMEQARTAIEPLAKQFGKESMAVACEVLIEISTPGKDTVARLKPHVRRMAYQMLGPEPAPDAVPETVVLPPVDPQPVATTSQPRETGKARKRLLTPEARSSTGANASPTSTAGRDSIMGQYRAAKEKHPGMLLLFRVGDFLEMFGEDAETAHKLLGLTLTTRDRTLTMAGFPHHQLEVYLRKLLHEGQRVAICEPVEELLARGPIRREVTRVVTPETVKEEEPEPAGAIEGSEPQATEEHPVRQPRHLVLKRCEEWFKKAGLAFVAIDDIRRTTSAVAPYIGVLDFIVMRGDEKLLVTVRSHLQTKHLAAIRELQNLYGPEYKPVRIWPSDGPDGWVWRDYPIDASACEPTTHTKRKPRPKRPRPSTSQ